jgi:hypothetical protein
MKNCRVVELSDNFNMNGELKKCWGKEKRLYIEMSEEELRAVWLEAGRPGVDKFYAAVLRSGLAVRRQAAQEFVKKAGDKAGVRTWSDQFGPCDRITHRRSLAS